MSLKTEIDRNEVWGVFPENQYKQNVKRVFGLLQKKNSWKENNHF